jgi:hypothetical protein
MLNHPDVLGVVAELHQKDIRREVERRRVAHQTATSASERRTRIPLRESIAAVLVRVESFVSGRSTRPRIQADSTGAQRR